MKNKEEINELFFLAKEIRLQTRHETESLTLFEALQLAATVRKYHYLEMISDALNVIANVEIEETKSIPEKLKHQLRNRGLAFGFEAKRV